MQPRFQLFPDQASTVASQVDGLYFFLLAVSAFFICLIFGLVIYFAIRFRRRSELDVPRPIIGSIRLELVWTVIPLVISMVIFGWGAHVYMHINTPPEDSLDILVVGKQWMWKLQHPQGQREINNLHVPTGQPIRLVMTSEDVIHSFFIPAFRIKKDVLPGRYTSVWFEATTPGTYHLFCAEYCGTKHSRMGGFVEVMTPSDYEQWLEGVPVNESPEKAGARLFTQFRCDTCHLPSGEGRGPALANLLGSQVTLNSGEMIQADETYIRESILRPSAKIVSGYRALMPTFQGQITESGILEILAYLKTLGSETESKNE